MNTKLVKSKICLAVSAAALTTSIAYAEENVIEEIIVTATGRSESVVDVPYNISAVSGDSINRLGISTGEELIRSITGVSAVERGHRNSGAISSIQIRGLNVEGSGQGDYALSTVPTVSTYINETPLFANFILRDIDRVEVLRGPQGTLYGSGSLGGTIKLITRKPDFDGFTAIVSGSGSKTDGSNGENWNGDLVLNMPVSDTVAMRVVMGAIDEAGVVDLPNVYVLDENQIPVAPDGPLADTRVFESIEDADTVKIKYGRVAIAWEPTDSISVVGNYMAQSDDIGGRRQTSRGSDGWGNPYGEYELGAVMREPSSRDVDLASLEITADLGFATLTSATSVYNHEGGSVGSNTGFYAQLGWLGAFYFNIPRPMVQAYRGYENNATVQEFRLVSNGNHKVDWLVGGFYSDEDKLLYQDTFSRGVKDWAEAVDYHAIIDDNDFSFIGTKILRRLPHLVN